MRPLVFLAGLAALAATPAVACDNVAAVRVKLGACIDAAYWQAQAPQGAQEFVYFSDDESIAVVLLTDSGALPVSDYRAAILAGAADAYGGPEQVQVIAERIERVGGRPWNVLEYEAGAEGEKLRFQNFYFVDPDFGAAEFIFWSLPVDATSAAYRAGQLLLSVTFE